MKKKEKKFFLKKNRPIITTNIATALFIAFVLVISSSVIGIDLKNNQMEIKNKEDIEKQSINIAPTSLMTSSSNTPNDNFLQIDFSKNGNHEKLPPPIDIMYGYICDPVGSGLSEGPVSFNVGTPDVLNQLKKTESCEFLHGGTWVKTTPLFSQWYGIQYANGQLWTFNEKTGKMNCIGGGGVSSMTGLAYNDSSDTLYACDVTSLYTIEKVGDVNPGKLTYVGDFNIADILMVGIAYSPFDNQIYGVDVFHDSLYKIEPTGKATLIAPLTDAITNDPIPIEYAQDIAFDKYNDKLYLTAYLDIISGDRSFLYTCNVLNAKCTKIGTGPFQGNAEITTAAIPYCHECSCNDLFYETFPGPTFPPTGWTTDYWTLNYSNYAGGTSPEARCNKDHHPPGQYWDNYIMSPPVKVNCGIIVLDFNFSANLLKSDCCSFYVKWRNNNGIWNDVTPWSNPLSRNIAGPYKVIIDCGPGNCDNTIQIKWEYLGYYFFYYNFYLDDVKISCCNLTNLPPSQPTITGSPDGNVLTWYDFFFESTDPEGHPISYYVDWDDGTTTPWSKYMPSGQSYHQQHAWISEDTFTIKAKAKDICGLESDWRLFRINIPRNREKNISFLKFLEQFPNALPILQKILKLG